MKNFVGLISAVFVGLMTTLVQLNDLVDFRKISGFYRCGVA